MPSVIVGGQSGGHLLIVGNIYSGQLGHPVGSLQLRLHTSAAGMVYVSLSGTPTINSGGFALSGGGFADGMMMAPGDAYSLPKVAFQTSGQLNVYVTCDALASGQARLYWENF